MLTIRHRLEMFFIIIFGTALGLFLSVKQNTRVDRRVFSAVVLPSAENLPQPTIATSSVYSEEIMDSPDGKQTLRMKKQTSGSVTAFTVDAISQEDGENRIVTKQLTNGFNITIPFNTWSPDNSYIFLKEQTPAIHNYLVFKASGNKISDTMDSLNIQTSFSDKLPDYKIEDVTGWANPTLLLVNSVQKTTNQKVSFWFDVTNQSFTQLGTYFN